MELTAVGLFAQAEEVRELLGIRQVTSGVEVAGKLGRWGLGLSVYAVSFKPCAILLVGTERPQMGGQVGVFPFELQLLADSFSLF